MPPTRERFVAIAHLSPTTPVPARLWKRFAECFANAPPWVRARGAHCKTVCTRSACKPFAVPLARSLRGALANGAIMALPKGTPPRRLHAIGQHWLCLWVVRSSFAVRASCAHQRLGNASLKAQRFQRRAGGGVGSERFVIITSPFSRARTKGMGMLRTRQSASKDGAVEEWAVKGL